MSSKKTAMAHPSTRRSWTITSHLEPGQAEALVEMAVPVLRDMLREYWRKQAEGASAHAVEEPLIRVARKAEA